MTEDQIEAKVESEINRLDRQLMDGKITQEEYDDAVYILDRWADQQYKHVSA
jgi:hypothetical protein